MNSTNSVPVQLWSHNSAPSFDIPCYSDPVGYSLRSRSPFPHPLATSPSFIGNTALAPKPIHSSASSPLLSDAQVPPHFLEAAAYTHELTWQLKPVTLLRQSAAAAHHNPLTSDSCSVPDTLGEPLVSSAVTGKGRFLYLIQRKLVCGSCLMFPTVECNGKSKKKH